MSESLSKIESKYQVLVLRFLDKDISKTAVDSGCNSHDTPSLMLENMVILLTTVVRGFGFVKCMFDICNDQYFKITVFLMIDWTENLR